MYNENELRKYDYFKQILDHEELLNVLDPLTGLIARTHMIELTKSLVESKTPFSFGMIDLDNFKEVNDTYGHSMGDEILASVAESLMEFLGEDGLAGRYGGDEILFINTRNLTYEANKAWCDEMYETGSVLKKVYKLSTRELFVTGTLGMATYPKDAKDYNELFGLIDKCLYRGKSKGRNCYIVYVEKLHNNIVIKNLKSNTMYESFKNLSKNLSLSSNINEKMRLGYEAIKNDIHITNMFYIKNDDDMLISVVDNKPFMRVPDLKKFVSDDVSAITSIRKIADTCPDTMAIFEKTEYDTLLIARIADGKDEYGYLVCSEPKIQRIWQDPEIVTMYYFAKMLAINIRQANNNQGQ